MASEPLLPAQSELPALTTARLLLRAMRLTDAPEVFDYARVPDVLRYTTGTPPRDLSDTLAFLRHALAAADDRMWAIQLRDAPAVIGAIEFGMPSPTSGSIHYALAMPYWGKGVMTEAVAAICEWAFASLPSLLEINTSVVEANVASSRVLEKCGFTRTGTVREEWAKEQDPVSLSIFHRDRRTGIMRPAP